MKYCHRVAGAQTDRLLGPALAVGRVRRALDVIQVRPGRALVAPALPDQVELEGEARIPVVDRIVAELVEEIGEVQGVGSHWSC